MLFTVHSAERDGDSVRVVVTCAPEQALTKRVYGLVYTVEGFKRFLKILRPYPRNTIKEGNLSAYRLKTLKRRYFSGVLVWQEETQQHVVKGDY